MKNLSRRQSEVLDYIAKRCKQGVFPTVRDVSRAIGCLSPSGSCCHLKALRKKGKITWEPGLSRTIRTTLSATGIPIITMESLRES